MNPEDLSLLVKATAFAACKHKDQRRRDVEASPYINHPITLADILCNEAHVTDSEVICAALLHDTVEDTDTTPEELEREFGAAIRDIVRQFDTEETVSDQQVVDRPESFERDLLEASTHRVTNQQGAG